VPRRAAFDREVLLDLAREVSEKHTRREQFICHARSPKPVMVDHGRPRGFEPVTLVCTEPGFHEGNHRDGIHCWTTHTFTREQAGPPRNKDISVCSCGRGWSDCKAGELALAVLGGSDA
jgi:hypothetical protein